MVEWLGQSLWLIGGLLGVWGLILLVRHAARCRHPNPHYVRSVTRCDGGTVAATYQCYECGHTWPETLRDPAWHATRIVSKFSGFDPSKAPRAAMRAVIEAEQRRFLAATRASPQPQPRSSLRTRRRRQRGLATNIVQIDSKRPA